MSLPTLQVQPHQLTPLLAAPRSIAFLFAGAAGYVGFVDPHVRNSLEQTRQRLRHWTGMYKLSLKVMGSLALIGAGFGALCYWQTKQNLWAVGAGLMASLWPYTLIVLMPTNKYLVDLDQKLDPNRQLQSGQKYTVLEKIKYWVNGHRGRIAISLVAAAVFYLAELKSTQSVDVSVKLK